MSLRCTHIAVYRSSSFPWGSIIFHWRIELFTPTHPNFLVSKTSRHFLQTDHWESQGNSPQLQQEAPANPPTRESNGWTTDLHLFVSSSRSTHSVSSPALQKNWGGLPCPPFLIYCASHRSSPNIPPSFHHCFIPTCNSSMQPLLTQKPLQIGKQIGWLYISSSPSAPPVPIPPV